MEQPELKLDTEMMCECGDTASQHVDGCEQCVVPECGCKEFSEAEQEAPEPDADLINETFMEHGKEALMEQGMSEEEAEASVREQVGIE